MTLRRFQNFQLGALNAQRLNEIVDSIARLQARVDRYTGEGEEVRRSILARITGAGVKSGGKDACGSGSIQAVSYPFQEVLLRITPTGSITASTCVDSESAEGGIRSSAGGFLVRFEDEPSLKVGSVVMAQLAPFAATGNADDKQMVYVALGGAPAGGALRLGRVTSSMTAGVYTARFLGPGEQDEVEFRNIYEVENYYGATSASIECAEIMPKPIPVESVVWLQQVLGDTGPNARYPDNSWVTLVPVAFDSECTCGPGGIAAQQQYGEGVEVRDVDAAAAGIILDKAIAYL